MLVDSHCHIDFPDYDGKMDALRLAMQANGVSHALCVSVNLPDWPRGMALAERYAADASAHEAIQQQGQRADAVEGEEAVVRAADLARDGGVAVRRRGSVGRVAVAGDTTRLGGAVRGVAVWRAGAGRRCGAGDRSWGSATAASSGKADLDDRGGQRDLRDLRHVVHL